MTYHQYPLRLPAHVHDLLKKSAARNRRSMNSEIVFCLEKVLTEATEARTVDSAAA